MPCSEELFEVGREGDAAVRQGLLVLAAEAAEAQPALPGDELDLIPDDDRVVHQESVDRVLEIGAPDELRNKGAPRSAPAEQGPPPSAPLLALR